MPDIISVLARRGKLIFILTAVATILALIISLLRPKEYLAVATALPANSLAADKARIFNSNIESLYPELGIDEDIDEIRVEVEDGKALAFVEFEDGTVKRVRVDSDDEDEIIEALAEELDEDEDDIEDWTEFEFND